MIWNKAIKRGLELLIPIFLVLIMASSAYAVPAVNVVGQAYGNGLGGSEMITNNDGITPLADGSLLQFVSAGANSIIDPPNSDGTPGGDDVLLQTSIVGFFGIDGAYYINQPVENNLTVVYLRAWNGVTAATATHYGNSAPHTISTAGEPPPPQPEYIDDQGPPLNETGSFPTDILKPGPTAPTVGNVSPNGGSASDTIGATGTDFGSTGTVWFVDAGTGTSYEADATGTWNPTSLTGIGIPTMPIGTYEVVVVNGDTGTSGSWGGTFYKDIPHINSITGSPANRGTTGRTISGVNFEAVQGTGVVHFGSLTAAVTGWNANTITYTVPSDAATGANAVYVTTNSLGDSNTVSFTVNSTFTITPTPTNGNPGDINLTVTINGTNTWFVGGTIVNFGGGITEGAPYNITPTQLQVDITIPGGEPSGAKTINITSNNPDTENYTGSFTVNAPGNSNPNDPTSLVQYKFNGTTVIPQGQWTNENSVILRFSMSDTDNPEILTPQVEATSGIFTGNPNYTGSAVAYSGTPVNGSVNPTGLSTNTSYNWRARTDDDELATSGWVDYNVLSPDFSVDLTVPTNPTGCTETGGAVNNTWQNSVSTPSFNWTGAADTGGSGVHGYSLYWGNNESINPGVTETQTGNTYNSGAITSGNTYYLRVRTFDSADVGNAGNYSAPITVFIFRYDATAPAVQTTSPPDGITGQLTTEPVTVTFDEIASEIASGLDPATIIAANFTVSGSVSGIHVTAPTLSTNTVALNHTGTFFPGETVTCTVNTGVADIAGNNLASPYQWTFTILMAPPTKPAGFTGTAITTTSITWEWIDVPDEASYQVYDGGTPASGVLPMNTIGWLEDTGLSPNTQYARFVRASNAGGPTDSDQDFCYTLANDPTGLVITGVTANSIALSWNPALVGGNAAYRIERAPDAGGFPGAWATIVDWVDGLATPTYNNINLLPDTTYWYRVSGFNGDGVVTTGFTGPVNGTTDPGVLPIDVTSYEADGGVMKAYPNPFDPNNEILKMQFAATEGDIYIFDETGRVVWKKHFRAPSGSKEDIEDTWNGDTVFGTKVPNGYYMVRVVEDGELVAKGKILAIRQ